MINRTRIFISSAYEDSLKPLRKKLKKHLEDCGHEVPIFEDGDFGTWEKNSLAQCLKVVRDCDVFILLINQKARAGGELMPGNITPTFLEYIAAKKTNKHILVFVESNVKNAFDSIKIELDMLHTQYVNDKSREPDSPFDPFKDWIEKHKSSLGMAKVHLEKADPFIFAFLYELYGNREWLYDFEFTDENMKSRIAQMLSTSFRSVVGLIPDLEKLYKLEETAVYLNDFPKYSIDMVTEKEILLTNEDVKSTEKWSNFLQKGITIFCNDKDIIQAPDFNPTKVNTITGCHGASLYNYDPQNGEILTLVGTAGAITEQEFYQLSEDDIYVVQAYKNKQRIISYNESKKLLYVTIPLGNFVLCLHFLLKDFWTNHQVTAYNSEIEYAIIDETDYFYKFFVLLIGGKVS